MKEDTNNKPQENSLSFPIAPKKPSTPPTAKSKAAVGEGGKAKGAITSALGTTDRAIAETLAMAEEIVEAELQPKKRQKARVIADAMIRSTDTTLDEVTDFLSRMFSSGNLLELAGATQIVTGETVEGELNSPLEAEVVE